MNRRPLPVGRIAGLLDPSRGLTSEEARDRAARYGANHIATRPAHPGWDLARDTAKDPMIWFLAATSGLYALVGQAAEAWTLLLAILPLVGMDAFLHHRTQASTEELAGRLASRATVVRDGAAADLPAVEIVPGDLAIVAAGESFPADGVLLAGEGLQADESPLTGEAYPVAKRPIDRPPTDGDEPPVEVEHWGFAGTHLLTGRASLRVACTGGETLYGEIVRSAVSGTHARTPLQKAIARLVTVLIAAASGLCVVIGAARLGQGHGWLDALVSAITLATAALPEEFPVVFTFFLAVGVYRLARRQALVRRAVVVENVGRVTCICSDKTGTITEGRLRLAEVLPSPGIERDRLIALAALASRSDGDPLDLAILHETSGGGASEVIATFPFTEGRKRETAVRRGAGGALLAATKGAAETVLAMAEVAGGAARDWDRALAGQARLGRKVIGCAFKELNEPGGGVAGAGRAGSGEAGWDGAEPERGYRFAGLLAFEDPVKEGVAEAIGICRASGIHAIMVTGDHPETARAVARAIGFGDGVPEVISGDEMERLAASGEGGALRRVDVIARAAPAQKLALVRALQEDGEIVALTGDGINDVPALQAADVGIAMGERGTKSAREVAAIVLLNDNFSTIVRAIGEGRQLFRNLRLSFEYLLMIHIPLVLTAALIPLAGYPLLYLPIHIVWLEMIIHPTALLVFQELPPGQRLDPVRARAAPARAVATPPRFFSARDWAAIVGAGGLVTGLIAFAYLRALHGGGVEHGRAMALAILTFASAAVTASLSGLRSRLSRLIAVGTVALSLGLIQIPAAAAILHVAPLHAGDWAIAVAGGLLAAGLPRLIEAARRRA